MPEHVEHLWTVLCRDVHRDPHGLVSLDGLLDMVSISSLPAEPALIQFECFVASHWRRNAEPGVEFRQRVMFQRGDDASTRVQVAGPDTVRVVDRHLFSVINKIPALPLHGHGQYFFSVERQLTDDGDWAPVSPTAGLWVPSPEMLGPKK
jgi:hypothetical protein